MDFTRQLCALFYLMAGILLLFFGCATIQGDWQDATRKNTIPAYEQFITHHPETPEAGKARQRIEDLRADQDWKALQAGGTIEGYQNFLKKHPNSKYTTQAKNRLEPLEAARDWRKAQEINSIDGYKEYLAKHPKSKDDALAAKKLEELKAEADWQKIKDGGTLQEYSNYYYQHMNSKYAGEASARMSQLQAEADWKDALEKNTEDQWVRYIVKYTGTARADEACKHLRKHTVVRDGGLIPWAALGGKSWSQTDPERDGFSNLYGALISNATVIRLSNYFGYECNDKTTLYFSYWVHLNKVKCIGDLRANAKGFTVVKGMALIPKDAK